MLIETMMRLAETEEEQKKVMELFNSLYWHSISEEEKQKYFEKYKQRKEGGNSKFSIKITVLLNVEVESKTEEQAVEKAKNVLWNNVGLLENNINAKIVDVFESN